MNEEIKIQRDYIYIIAQISTVSAGPELTFEPTFLGYIPETVLFLLDRRGPLWSPRKTVCSSLTNTHSLFFINMPMFFKILQNSEDNIKNILTIVNWYWQELSIKDCNWEVSKQRYPPKMAFRLGSIALVQISRERLFYAGRRVLELEW